MTSLTILFGAGLFLVLMFVLLVGLGRQTSPQSEVLEQITRERMLRRRAGEKTPSVLLEWFAKPLSLFRRFISQHPDPAVVRRLSLAGYRHGSHVEVFLASRLMVPAALAIFVVLFIRESIFLYLPVSIVLGYFVPDFWLAAAINGRKARIDSSLPDALDLMSICLDAGLGLDQAIVRVGQELQFAHPDVSHELLQINLEQRAGVPRIESWKACAERLDIENLRQFVGMLVQTERFGTPIGVALTAFSESLRLQRRQKAEELGAKAAIKLVFPMVLFIFPTMFIVILGPAIVGLLRNVTGLLQ